MGLLSLADSALKSYQTYNRLKPWTDQGVRHPFVTLRLLEKEIPLLDAQRVVDDPAYAGSLKQSIQPLFLDSLVHQIDASTAGSNFLTLRILDPSFDYLESLIFGKVAELEYQGLTVEYGWRGKDDGYFTGPAPIPLYVQDIGVEVHPNRGTMVTLECVDQSASLFNGSHHLSFKEDQTVNEVIGQAIRKLFPTLDFAIDPILTKVGALKHMEGSSLGKYIKDLLEASKPTTGAQPLFTVQIVPPRAASGRSVLQIKAWTPEGPVRTYVYGREREGEMLSFSPTINLRAMAALAAGRATAVAIDPLTKTWVRVESTQREDRTVGPKRATITPLNPTDNIESPRNPDETASMVEGSRGNSDTAQWQATAVVLGDVELRPYNDIKIIVLKNPPTGTEVSFADSNSVHWASSGVWTIQQVVNQIEGGSFHSRLTMFRNAGFVGAGEDGTPLGFAFDTGQVNKRGEFVSRVQPLQNRDQLTGSAGVWNPL